MKTLEIEFDLKLLCLVFENLNVNSHVFNWICIDENESQKRKERTFLSPCKKWDKFFDILEKREMSWNTVKNWEIVGA